MSQKKIRHEQVDKGTGANQIVVLDALGRLPAIDGSLLTGVTATSDLVNDISPQLGGNLDLNSFNLFTVAVGSPTSASAESFNFIGGNNSAGAGTFTAGGATIQGGTGSNGNDGGPITINGGNSVDGGYGGYVSISSGSGTLTSGAGTISITGGNSSNSAFGGGAVSITSGDNLAASGAAAAGDIDFTAGDSTASTSGVGGSVSLYAGAGGDTGGDIILQPGNGVAGTDGTVQIKAASGVQPTLELFEDGANGVNKIAIAAPSNVTTDRTWVLPQDDPSVVGGQFLTTNASGELSFAEASAVNALNDLTDVIVAGSPAISGQVLKYNGTNWVSADDSGLFTEDVNNNIVGGTLAGDSLIAGSFKNFFAGYQAGKDVTTGDDNIAIGQYAGRTTITGSRNITIGSTTLANGTSGAKSDNIAIGNAALSQLAADSIENVAIGSSVGVAITGGSRNVLIGNSAGPTTDQSDQLFINNNQSDTPLIHGNFSTGGSPAAAGDVTINGQLLIENGSGSAPGIAFSSTPNMGIYQQSASIMSLVTNGQLRLDIGTTLHSRVQHNFNSGSAAAPTIVQLNDNGTGIYFVNPDEVHIATGSTDRLGIMSDGSLTVAGTTNYELLVTDDDDIPNKKYVDDAVITGGVSNKPQYESITLAGSPPLEIINTTVPTVAISGSPQLAGVQVFRNGMLQDEGVDVGSPATITDDFVVSGPNQITFAPGILKAGGKINIFAFV